MSHRAAHADGASGAAFHGFLATLCRTKYHDEPFGALTGVPERI